MKKADPTRKSLHLTKDKQDLYQVQANIHESVMESLSDETIQQKVSFLFLLAGFSSFQSRPQGPKPYSAQVRPLDFYSGRSRVRFPGLIGANRGLIIIPKVPAQSQGQTQKQPNTTHGTNDLQVHLATRI